MTDFDKLPSTAFGTEASLRPISLQRKVKSWKKTESLRAKEQEIFGKFKKNYVYSLALSFSPLNTILALLDTFSGATSPFPIFHKIQLYLYTI